MPRELGNAVFDFIDDDHAEGHLYCRAEHEIGEEWVIAMLRYPRPLQRRDDGKWYFRWRRVHLFYVTDMLERPMGPDRVRWPGRDTGAAEMPFMDESWQRFYGADGPGAGLGRTSRRRGDAGSVAGGAHGGRAWGGRGGALAGLADQPRRRRPDLVPLPGLLVTH